MHSRRLFFLVIAHVCMLTSAIRAQAPVPSEPGANSSPVPVIRANTRAVVVDVVVTRGRDEPVTDLHKQDFQVLEDGKPQPIDYFEEHTTRLAAQNIPFPRRPSPTPSMSFCSIRSTPRARTRPTSTSRSLHSSSP